MRASAAAAALALSCALATGLRADDGWSQHWLLRGVADVLREPAATVPVVDPLTGAVLDREPLAEHAWDAVGMGTLRYYGGWDPFSGLRLEWNLLGTALESSAAIPASAQPLGRSAVLERQPYEGQDAQIEAMVDQLNLRWQGDTLAVAVGRQPVNYGQNFYFSPLDLFQPFQAQATYRDFRPGVDAVRATYSPGRFTQLDAAAVAGYAPGPEGTNAVQDPLLLDGPRGQGSVVLHGQSGGDAWLVSALAGRFAASEVGGASLQLEGLGSSWTFESLAASGLDTPAGTARDQDQSTLGWTRQWKAWLNTRVEASGVFDSGGGASANPVSRLAAVAATIQATPLWTFAPALLWFGDVDQAFAILDAGWSASENGSLHLILELPLLFQEPDSDRTPPTETESLPSVLSVDYRLEL